MKTLLAALLLLSTAASAHTEAWQRKYLLASRNSGGTYSLPNAPVVTGTTITSSWANTTLADLATELTNSLDRSGRGAMTGPLRLNNAANAAIPDIAWGVESNTGFYRFAAGDIRFALGGVDNLLLTNATQAAFGFSALTGNTAVRFGPVGNTNLFAISNSPTLGFNTYFNSGFKYGSASFASTIQMDGSGNLLFATAPSGLLDAAATLTERFRVASTGVLISAPGIATGIPNNGSGFKHARVAGCNTAAAIGAQCAATITWTTAFADASYTATCQGALTAGIPGAITTNSKTAASLQVFVTSVTASGVQMAAIDCIAVHD